LAPAISLTDYHAKYLAHELTKRFASDSVEKLAAVLADAQVDLNPHQVEAALFAFRSPFSKGAILADEVGLGKTIEAGLLLAQKWAERKRRLLVILPANLRKQWSQELEDKFYLRSIILESRSFNGSIRAGNLNPFQQDAIVLCSYQFARTKEPYLRQTAWDLVVIDEAHRLRNVYKNTSKIAAAIKQALAPFPKVLLTAPPLQNSLLELYGLVSIIDDFAFGDLQSYRSRFARLGNDTDFGELKERLTPLCKRTLRHQVLEYVKYTNRHALVQEFVPTAEEQRLYDLVSGYLQRDTLYALLASQRQLVTLILRKLLASSTYAISGTLDSMVQRLQAAAAAAEAVATPPDNLPEDWEHLDELADEWDEDGAAAIPTERTRFTPEQLADLKREMAELREFHALAKSIIKNSKGEVLLTALRRGFAAATGAQAAQGSPGAGGSSAPSAWTCGSPSRRACGSICPTPGSSMPNSMSCAMSPTPSTKPAGPSSSARAGTPAACSGGSGGSCCAAGRAWSAPNADWGKTCWPSTAGSRRPTFSRSSWPTSGTTPTRGRRGGS